MKKIFILAAMAIGMIACSPKDIPAVSFSQDTYAVSRDGGELIIPVSSTGIDNVTIYYPDGDMWEVDSQTGDMIPAEGWIKLVKVINDYNTRALAQWTSGISLEIAPNDTDHERSATITVRSFNTEATVTVRQGF